MRLCAFFMELAEQIFKILVSGESYGSDLGRHVFLFCPGPQVGRPQYFNLVLKQW